MLMPEQPACYGLGRLIVQKDALPRDKHIFEPHLPVELVIAAAERGHEGVAFAGRDLSANHRHTWCSDRHDKGGAVPVDVHAGKSADIDILGISRAGMHADLAAEDKTGIGFADDLERGPLAGIFPQAIAYR